ncbi:hypothetical protein GF380_02720 [Candidatus Uhrbacteria bacterium]|nr:hypothetical protein [Candidatus Uhrbacteria bacterium]
MNKTYSDAFRAAFLPRQSGSWEFEFLAFGQYPYAIKAKIRMDNPDFSRQENEFVIDAKAHAALYTIISQERREEMVTFDDSEDARLALELLNNITIEAA